MLPDMTLTAAEQWAACQDCSRSVLRHKTLGGADMALIVPERCSDCDAAIDVGSVLNPPLGVQRLEQQPHGAMRDLQRLQGRRCACQQGHYVTDNIEQAPAVIWCKAEWWSATPMSWANAHLLCL